MIIRDHRGREHLLSYELNVHRGETLEEFYGCLSQSVEEVRRQLAPDAPFAIAPRIGFALIEALRDDAARREFRRFWSESPWKPHTVNAFPLGDFHATRVKDQVYAPSWADEKRCHATNAVTDLLAEALIAVGESEGNDLHVGGDLSLLELFRR